MKRVALKRKKINKNGQQWFNVLATIDFNDNSAYTKFKS